MPKKRKKADGPILSQRAWAVWKVYSDSRTAKEAEATLREHAEAALAAGRPGVVKDMLNVHEEFLSAARVEQEQECVSASETSANLVMAAGTVRRAAHLVGLGHPEEKDERLLKVLNGGLS